MQLLTITKSLPPLYKGASCGRDEVEEIPPVLLAEAVVLPEVHGGVPVLLRHVRRHLGRAAAPKYQK